MNESKFMATHLKDYRPSDYIIESVNLEFELDADETVVRSQLKIRANPQRSLVSTDIILDGEELELLDIKLDKTILEQSRYKINHSSLIIRDVPDYFTLDITTRIQPSKNTELQGLYISKGIFCTQCEAQGFRHITYFIDRPDIMARYTVTIIADKIKYPVLLSNGNVVQTVTWYGSAEK